MLIVEAETPRLHSIRHVPVQHPHPAYLGVVGDPDTTDRVVGAGRNLTSTPCPVSVGVDQVIPRSGVRVVVVHIRAGLRVVVGHQVWVTFLHAVVQDGDHDVLTSDAQLPGFLDVHVQHASSVDVPHEGISRVVEVHAVVEGGVGVNGWSLLLRHPPGLLLIIKTMKTSKLILVEPPLPPPPVLHHLLLCLLNMVVVLQAPVSLGVFLH